MNKFLKIYLIILGHLVLGLGILLLFERLKLPDWLSVSVLIFIAFLLLNLSYYYVFKLNDEIKEFWSLRKLPYLLWGALGGISISFLPILLKLITGRLVLEDIHFNADISLAGILLTFVIVGWEELWFRSLLLNYCNKYLSAIKLSLIIGLLFILLHGLNPGINPQEKGPALFFAGALLTILYFYYKSLWMPLGLHFGNNFFASGIEAGDKNNLLFGEDGYITAILLATLFITFLFKMKERQDADLAQIK